MIFGLICREISVFALQAVIGDKTSSKPPNIEWKKKTQVCLQLDIATDIYEDMCS